MTVSNLPLTSNKPNSHFYYDFVYLVNSNPPLGGNCRINCKSSEIVMYTSSGKVYIDKSSNELWNTDVQGFTVYFIDEWRGTLW